MQQHAVADADAVADLALDADGHVWAYDAVGANLGCGMYDVVAKEGGPLSQRLGVTAADAVQM